MSPCKPLYFISVLLVSAAGIVGFFVVGDKMRMTRMFATYFGCGDDYGGACYQSIHGIYALGTGGLWGTGLGSSKEKWSYLPEAHNDFIFAIIGEELGFVVCSLVILAFVFILLATIRIAVSLTNRFERTTVLLIGFWIFVQAMINIGVVLGVLPVIGIPLPFISAGGSSLIITLASVGIVLCFAKSNEEVAAKLQWRKAFRRFRQLFGK
jgi:cell division protein FtsW